METTDAGVDIEDGPISLRDYAKHRMMDDMISSVRKIEKGNNDYLILVMDDHTKQLFAGICNLFEIMTKSVFHLERLELKRKEFPATPAIYFISPTQKSIDKLIDDFQDLENPQYASVHLFFSTKLSDGLMEQLSSQEGLVNRVKSFCELNVDLNLYEDNIYHLDLKDSLGLFNMKPNDVTTVKYLSKIGLQIFTVWAVLNERPYIQYQGRSKLAEKVGKAVLGHFDDFQKKSPGHNFKEPRANLLILDRSFDMTSPLLHDYAYESLVYETVENGDEADKMCSEEVKQEKHGQSEKMMDRSDLVWHRYKNKHFANAMVTINNEISRFVQENKNIAAIKKGDALEVADLKDVLTTMPKYQELLTMYSKHLNMCQKVDQNLKRRKFIDLIKVEQMIISGLNESGKEVTNKDILKEIENIYRKLEPIDHIRLLMIYFACYEVPEGDMKTLLSTLSHEHHEACMNMHYILGKPSSGLIRRRVEVMDKNEFRDYSDRLASTDYEILKTTPAIVKLAQLAQENTLDQGVFPYVGEQPENMNRFGHSKINGYSKMKGKLRRRWQNKKDGAVPEHKLLIFVIGGLSHHEIVALNKMQEEKEIDCLIIQGGTHIFTPNQFVSQVKHLDQKKIRSNLDGMAVGEDSIMDIDQIGVDFT